MDMEIQFLHKNFTGKDPKLLTEHVQRMASGEAPFFAKTLSLVYDNLFEKIFAQPIPSGSDVGKPTEVPNAVVPSPLPQASTTTSSIPSSSTSSVPLSSTPGVTPLSNLQAPAPDPEPQPQPQPDPWSDDAPLGWLQCNQCGETARLQDLYEGVRCPQCPPRSAKKGRPYMQCQSCGVVRVTPRIYCVKIACRARFR